MPRHLHPALMTILPAAAALLLALPLAAQQPTSGSTQQPSTTQQTTTKQSDKKQTKKKTDSKKDSPAPQNPPAAPVPAAPVPSAPAPQNPSTPPPAPQPQHGTSTADQNPFPEAQSEQAAREAKQRQDAEPDTSSSSAVPGLNLPAKSSKQPAAPALNSSLGRQDTKVGDFYRQSGDWKGAYSRFLEATQADPGDAEAVFGLADSARHLGYRKVAIQNFQLYLSALPNGPRAKDARKALKDMGAQP